MCGRDSIGQHIEGLVKHLLRRRSTLATARTRPDCIRGVDVKCGETPLNLARDGKPLNSGRHCYFSWTEASSIFYRTCVSASSAFHELGFQCGITFHSTLLLSRPLTFRAGCTRRSTHQRRLQLGKAGQTLTVGLLIECLLVCVLYPDSHATSAQAPCGRR
jgi:hypothetical protein